MGEKNFDYFNEINLKTNADSIHDKKTYLSLYLYDSIYNVISTGIESTASPSGTVSVCRRLVTLVPA